MNCVTRIAGMVGFFALATALTLSHSSPTGAACATPGCKDKCVEWDNFCNGTNSGTVWSASIASSSCTNGASAGTPSLAKMTHYDQYSRCVLDCANDTQCTGGVDTTTTKTGSGDVIKDRKCNTSGGT